MRNVAASAPPSHSHKDGQSKRTDSELLYDWLVNIVLYAVGVRRNQRVCVFIQASVLNTNSFSFSHLVMEVIVVVMKGQ